LGKTGGCRQTLLEIEPSIAMNPTFDGDVATVSRTIPSFFLIFGQSIQRYGSTLYRMATEYRCMHNFMIDETLQLFANLIEERFAKEIFTTEDSVRYTFFYCLTKSRNLSPSDIILEQPHPSIPRAEVDMYVPAKDGIAEFFFEFKFDRTIPSEKNAPKPQKAGKIFADLVRLALLKPNSDGQCHLVYVTDEEMASYFMNKKNRLDDFFNLLPEETLVIDNKYITTHCETFAKTVENDIIPFEIKCRLSKKLKQEIWLRVYGVNQQSQGTPLLLSIFPS
jgi:hypothetical protein